MAEGGGEEKASGGSPAVFVSYASQDTAVANSIVESLERSGLRCWIAPRDVTPGSHYADDIMSAISGAKVVVLVLSESALASKHVGKEIERASSKGRPIVALRTDAVPLTPAFEYFLSESQWIDVATAGIAAAAGKLVEAVRAHADLAGATGVVAARMVAGHSAVSPSKPWIISAAGAIVIALLGYVVVDKYVLSNRRTASPSASAQTDVASERSIAVLPFTDMSESHDQEYFADGMAEELLDLLAKVPGLRVIGRTSSFQWKGKSLDLRTIGRTLGAAYLLEGSVRKAGDRLRVTAQLIAARDGSHVWSESYDEVSGDVLNVQDRIAAGLVRALQVTVGADDLQVRPVLKSPEAYDLYLRGRHSFDRFDQEGFEAAASYFENALKLDPSFAHAAEWIAIAHESSAEWGYVPPREGYERTRQDAERALKLNPRSGNAHAMLSDVHTIYDWDWEAAADESRLALEFEPGNANVIVCASDLAKALGHWDEAIRLIKSGFVVDPLFAAWHESLGNILYRTGRLTDAEAELRKALAISPTYGSGHYYLGQILLAQGNVEAALTEMRQEAANDGRDAGLAIVYHAMKRKTDSEAAINRLTITRAGEAAFQIAEAHAYRGEVDMAFAWLDRAYLQKDVELYLVKGDPLLKNLESDARYKAFLRKMKVPE